MKEKLSRKDKYQILSTIISGFEKQQEFARGNSGTCLYRTPEGNKCAVGMLIPDDKYYVDMEGWGFSENMLSAEEAGMKANALFIEALQINIMNSDISTFLWELQHIHDAQSDSVALGRSTKSEALTRMLTKYRELKRKYR